MTKPVLPPFGPAQYPRPPYHATQWLVPDDFDKAPAKKFPVEKLLRDTKQALNLVLHHADFEAATFDHTRTPYGMIESVYPYQPQTLAQIIGDIFDPGYTTKDHGVFGDDLLGMVLQTFIPLNALELQSYRPWMSRMTLVPPYTAQPQEPESPKLAARIRHGLLIHEYNPVAAQSIATLAANAITTFLHRLDNEEYIEILAHAYTQDENFFNTASADLEKFTRFLTQHRNM